MKSVRWVVAGLFGCAVVVEVGGQSSGGRDWLGVLSAHLRRILILTTTLLVGAVTAGGEPSRFVVGRLLREGYTPVEAGPDWRTWARTNDIAFDNGGVVGRTNAVIELQTGMNVWSGEESRWATSWLGAGSFARQLHRLVEGAKRCHRFDRNQPWHLVGKRQLLALW